MNTALILVVVLLVLLLMLMAVALIMYYTTQQDLKTVSARLNALEPAKPARSADLVRRERSAAYDKLVMLEASFSSQPREELTPEDIAVFEESRQVFKACNAELQRMQAWLGLPYDLDWTDAMDRLPRTIRLYRDAVEEAAAQAPAAR